MTLLNTARTFPVEVILEEAAITLLGVPSASSVTGLSTAHAPHLIRYALKFLEGFHPEYNLDIYDSTFCDVGDVEAPPGNPEKLCEIVSDSVNEIFTRNPQTKLITLGGEHLLSYPIITSLPKPCDILVIDAHADLRPKYYDQSLFHGSWLHHTLKKTHRKAAVVGLRSFGADENTSILVHPDELTSPIYLSVDLDGFDPSIAPEVGTPEPAGLLWKDFQKIMRKVRHTELISADIVESSALSLDAPTIHLAAAVLKEIIALMITQKK